MPVDVSAAASQAMENMGVTEEDIQAQVAAATISGDVPPTAKKKEGLKEVVEEETEEVEEVEEEEPAEEEPSEETDRPKTVPISRFNKVYREMKEMERYLQALVTEREQLIGEIRRGPKQQEREPEVDYDTLTPGELARQLKTEMSQTVADAVRDVFQKEVAPLKSNMSLERARADMNATAKVHSDYWDYQEPMIDIAKAHPDLTAEEVYLLATGNAKKVKSSVLKRTQEKIQQKKRAVTEKHSSPTQTTTQVKTFKNVKDIARSVAEKMGLDK